jgi:hypothetical protein
VKDVHQDGTISVLFGCDHNCLSSVKPGAEVMRFKEANVRLVGPMGAHEELLRLHVVIKADAVQEAELPASPAFVSDIEPALHDPKELKKLAAYVKAVMPTVVHVDEVRRTFSMHEIVQGQILQGLGSQTDRMRALLHCRCGQYLDEEQSDRRLHPVFREIACVAAALAVTCRRLGALEGEGWGCGMLMRIFETARETWGYDSRVTTRCLTLAHAVLVADICHQWLMKNTITSSVNELADVPAVREVLDACVGPFNLARCLRTYLSTDSSKLTNLNDTRLKCMSWRYRSLRGSVDTDEKVLEQMGEVVRLEADATQRWDLLVIQLKAVAAAAIRLQAYGLIDKSLQMHEKALQMSTELLGSDHPHTMFVQVQIFGLKQKLGLVGGGAALATFVNGNLQIGVAPPGLQAKAKAERGGN